jgi:hypothetical protein
MLFDTKVKMSLLACNDLPAEEMPEQMMEESGYSTEEVLSEGQDFNEFIQSAMDVFNGKIIPTSE